MPPELTALKSRKGVSYPDQRWSELIQKMAGGDQSSLAEFYNESNRLVFGLALRIVNDRSAAEEIVLDTYHQVWRQSRNFDPQRGKPSSWILMIARRRAIDQLRSSASAKQQQAPLEDAQLYPDGNESPEGIVLLGELQQMIHKALAQLNSKQRELIEIAFFSGQTQLEISDKLGIPLGTVKTRIRTGMLKLRELLMGL